mmetsp:Transcript_11095/g.23569  ORF Transcript_11095/g.23569 Transcript_11095/m.23569 type:complete len:317 (-) Transcript_11095:140-1090(-)
MYISLDTSMETPPRVGTNIQLLTSHMNLVVKLRRPKLPPRSPHILRQLGMILLKLPRSLRITHNHRIHRARHQRHQGARQHRPHDEPDEERRGGRAQLVPEDHSLDLGDGERDEAGDESDRRGEHAEDGVGERVGDYGGPASGFEEVEDVFAGFDEGVAVKTYEYECPLVEILHNVLQTRKEAFGKTKQNTTAILALPQILDHLLRRLKDRHKQRPKTNRSERRRNRPHKRIPHPIRTTRRSLARHEPPRPHGTRHRNVNHIRNHVKRPVITQQHEKRQRLARILLALRLPVASAGDVHGADEGYRPQRAPSHHDE